MNRTSNRDASSRNNQNRQRNRGRNNNGGGNRRGPNPLQRSYESNGPEVKIRGNAMQVAEKYQALARDAQVAGDRILAENYLQHAEHYSRIIAAAQAASQQAQQEQPTSQNAQPNANTQAQQPVSGTGPQPVISSDAPAGENAATEVEQPEVSIGVSAEDVERPKPARGRRRRVEPEVQQQSDGHSAESVEPAALATDEKPQRKPRTRRPRVASKPVADVVDIAEPVQPEAAE